jgi:cytochrome P450
MRASITPEHTAIDLTQVAQLGNQLITQLDELREATPLAWNDSVHAWVAARHADITEALAGTRLPLSNRKFEHLFDAFSQSELATLPLMAKSVPEWIFNIDPPKHTRLRKLAVRGFTPKVIEDLRPFVRATITDVLDRAASHAHVEFVGDVARAITGRVICHLIGVPEDNVPRLEAWALNVGSALGNPVPNLAAMQAAEQSLREMAAVLLPAIQARQTERTSDFLSQLVTAREGDDRLSEDEILGLCFSILLAGHDTTMNSMTLGLIEILRDDSARAHLLTNPGNISLAVLEILRISAMGTALPKRVLEDFEWHGQKLRAGDTVLLLLANANRDPRVFPRPETMDMTRPPGTGLVFGAGIHHCVGHLLAKMQLEEFYPVFFKRFGNIEILDEELKFNPGLAFRGLEHLHLRINAPRGTLEHPV